MHTSPHLPASPAAFARPHNPSSSHAAHNALRPATSPISPLARRGGVLEATRRSVQRGGGAICSSLSVHSHTRNSAQRIRARIRGDGSHYSHCAPQGSSVWLSCRSTPVDLIRAGDPREWLDARPPLFLSTFLGQGSHVHFTPHLKRRDSR